MHANTCVSVVPAVMEFLSQVLSEILKCGFVFWNFLRCAVPISLEVIQSRLENNYYRNLEALKHDFKVMLLNAETYLESNAVKRTSDKELLAKLKCISDWFTQTISSL